MATEYLKGEVVRKSIQHKLYVVFVADKEITIEVLLDQLPEDTFLYLGDEISFEAEKNNDAYLFKRFCTKVGNKFFEELKHALDAQTTIRGYVFEKNAGGYRVSYKGYRCFLPFSESYYKYDPLIGNHEILETEKNFHVKGIVDNNVILTRVNLDQQEKIIARKTESEALYEGFSFYGTIKQISDYGMFLRLKNSYGLFLFSEMLNIDTKFLKQLRAQYHILFKEVFEEDETLYVTVLAISADKQQPEKLNYTLGWDTEHAANKPYWERICKIVTQDERFSAIKIRMSI